MHINSSSLVNKYVCMYIDPLPSNGAILPKLHKDLLRVGLFMTLRCILLAYVFPPDPRTKNAAKFVIDLLVLHCYQWPWISSTLMNIQCCQCNICSVVIKIAGKILIACCINRINEISNICVTKKVYNSTLPLNKNNFPELLTIDAWHQLSNFYGELLLYMRNRKFWVNRKHIHIIFKYLYIFGIESTSCVVYEQNTERR